MGMEQVSCTIRGRSLHWSDRLKKSHKKLKWFQKQRSAKDKRYTELQKVQLRRRMEDNIFYAGLDKWNKKWHELNLLEYRPVAERLGRKSSRALRFMSATLGFVLGMLTYSAYASFSGNSGFYGNFPLIITNCALNPELMDISSEDFTTMSTNDVITERNTNISCQKSAQNSVTIEGKVIGYPHYMNGLQGAKVIAYDAEINEAQDTAYTDDSGNYNMTFLWTGIREGKNEGLEGKLSNYPNPYFESTNINVACATDKSYNLVVVDMAGKQVLNEKLAMQKGVNRVTLSGGAPGVYLLVLDDGQTRQVAKSVNISSSNKAYTATVTNIGDFFKDGIVDGTLVRLEFTKDGYNLKDTTFTVALENTINVQMDMIPLTYNFNVSAISVVTGDKVIDGTALKVTWGDGTNNTYSSLDGIININRETYDTTKSIFIENADTTFYQEWIFGLKKDPQITTKEVNLFQSEKVSSGPPGTPYVHPTPAPANLNSLPSEFDVIFVPNLVEDSQGNVYHTTGELFRTVLGCQGPPWFTKKWEYVPEVADTVYLYEMQMNGYSGNPITPEQSASQTLAMDFVESQLFYLNPSRQLMPPYKRIDIVTKQEPEWLEGTTAPRSFDQIHVIEYNANNNNGAQFSFDYTMTEHPRFKNGTANYTSSSSIVYKMEEILQSFTHWSDPSVSINLGGYVVKSDGTMTSFGKAARISSIANPYTPFR